MRMRWSTREQYGEAMGKRVRPSKRAGLAGLLMGVVVAAIAVVLWLGSVAFSPIIQWSIIVSGFSFGVAAMCFCAALIWGRQARWYTSADGGPSWARMPPTRENDATAVVVVSILGILFIVFLIVWMVPYLFDVTPYSDDRSLGYLLEFVLDGLVLAVVAMVMGFLCGSVGLLAVSIHDRMAWKKGK